MRDAEYRELALRTEKPEGMTLTVKQARLLHGAIDLAGEAGELLDQVKRHLFYGLALDTTNVVEESGDCLWYLNLALDAVRATLEEAKKLNIAKLAKRYPEHRFDQTATANRDLAAERAVLEGGPFTGRNEGDAEDFVCKLKAPGGSECGTCPCRSPNDCLNRQTGDHDDVEPMLPDNSQACETHLRKVAAAAERDDV